MLHCDLRVRWKVASDLRFRAAISEPKTGPLLCVGFLAIWLRQRRNSLAIAIVRLWCDFATTHISYTTLIVEELICVIPCVSLVSACLAL